MIIKTIVSLISNITTALLIYFSYIFLFDILIDNVKRKEKRLYKQYILKNNAITDLPVKEDFNSIINTQEKNAYFILAILFGFFNTWQKFLNITLIILIAICIIIEKAISFHNVEFFESKSIKKQLIITGIFCIIYLCIYFYK